MKHRFGRVSTVAVMLFTQAKVADAHVIASRLGDFYTGALHPLTDLQDFILWTAMGVLAGSLGAAKGRWLVLMFPMGLLAGLVLERTPGLVTAGPVVDAGMILLLGLLLAAAARLPAALLCVIAFGVAVTRGVANVSDLAPETDRVLFAAGLACAGYAAVTLITALTLVFSGPDAGASTAWRSIAIRAFGGWIAAIGLMMVGLAFANHSL